MVETLVMAILIVTSVSVGKDITITKKYKYVHVHKINVQCCSMHRCTYVVVQYIWLHIYSALDHTMSFYMHTRSTTYVFSIQ